MKKDERKTKAQLIRELDEMRAILSHGLDDYGDGKQIEPLDHDIRYYLNQADVVIVVINRDESIAMINRKACAFLGYSEQEITGKNFFSTFIPGRNRSTLRKQFNWLMSGKMELIQIQHENSIITKNGEEKIITWQTSVLTDDMGCINGMIASGVDITERKQAEEALRAMLFLDELTGLYNRRGFQAMARQQISLSNRIKSEILLLYTDIDGMKNINDSFGHPEGDRALMDAAKVLRSTFRQSDIIARIGGDEFVVMTIGSKDTEAQTIIDRFQEQLTDYNKRHSRPYTLSMSTGVAASVSQFPCAIEEFIARADKLMYREKKAGLEIKTV